MAKVNNKERTEAIERLREWIKPGDTVYTVLDHVSSSGMSRAIRVILLSCDGSRVVDLHPNYAVGKALGLRHWKRNGREQDALVVEGAGMDMGFEIVYNLGRTLWPDGFSCIGEGCHANDHANGDRDYTPDHCVHNDGGYALRHRWL
jgi:hypothetical protein